MPKRKRPGLRLKADKVWWIASVTDSAEWLRSLTLLEPSDAVLYLEGVDDADIVNFLERNPYPEPTAIGPMSIWPRLSFHHIAATPDNLENLAKLMETGKAERLAYHAALYRGQTLFLEWFESFCPPEDQGINIGKGGITEGVQSPMYASYEVPEDECEPSQPRWERPFGSKTGLKTDLNGPAA